MTPNPSRPSRPSRPKFNLDLDLVEFLVLAFHRLCWFLGLSIILDLLAREAFLSDPSYATGIWLGGLCCLLADNIAYKLEELYL